MVTVIFPAAGKGKRMKSDINKVFLDLAGVPVLIRSLLRFSSCPKVDNLVVVVAEAEVKSTQSLLQKTPGLKPWQVVAGGSERQYSVLNGIKSLPDARDDDIILVHDAARPLVSVKTIEGVIDMAIREGSAIAAVPAKNTIKVCDAEGRVVNTPDRATLWEVQTPQGFKCSVLLAANKQAIAEDFLGTDDASLVERLGLPVYVVESDYGNIKITTPEDILMAKSILADTLEELQLQKLLAKSAEAMGEAISSLRDAFKGFK